LLDWQFRYLVVQNVLLGWEAGGVKGDDKIYYFGREQGLKGCKAETCTNPKMTSDCSVFKFRSAGVDSPIVTLNSINCKNMKL